MKDNKRAGTAPPQETLSSETDPNTLTEEESARGLRALFGDEEPSQKKTGNDLWGQCPFLKCPDGALSRQELVEHLVDFHHARPAHRRDDRI